METCNNEPIFNIKKYILNKNAKFETANWQQEEFGNTIKKAKKNEKTELGKVCKAQRSKAIPPPCDGT